MTLTPLPLPKVLSYIYKTTSYNIIHEYHIPSDGYVFSRGRTHHQKWTQESTSEDFES